MRGGEERRGKESGASMKRRICRAVPDRTLSAGKISF